jgi:cobalt-zinc-cadmium efflux system protein
MGHGHHHHHIDPEAGDRRVALAVLANLGLTVAQVAGGLLAGSLSLIADALHNFSDAVSLIIAFLARRIARRPADRAMTFGYGRAEVVAALVNYTTLIVIGLYLLVEAAGRFADPEPVTGWLMIAVGRRGAGGRPRHGGADLPALEDQHEHPRGLPAQPRRRDGLGGGDRVGRADHAL